MNDIDTISEALENSKLRCLFREDSESCTTALSALERVSALQAEMESALEMVIQEFIDPDHDEMKCVKFARETLAKSKAFR